MDDRGIQRTERSAKDLLASPRDARAAKNGDPRNKPHGEIVVAARQSLAERGRGDTEIILPASLEQVLPSTAKELRRGWERAPVGCMRFLARPRTIGEVASLLGLTKRNARRHLVALRDVGAALQDGRLWRWRPSRGR